MTIGSSLGPCEPLPLLMYAQHAEGKAGATVLFPAHGPGYSNLPQESPLWAEGGSCQDFFGSSPAHFQTYYKAELQGMV